MENDIKALCLDMDGTLLNHHNQISDRTLEVIQHVRAKGILVFIVTGRSLLEVYDSAPEDIQLDGVVTANGMITHIHGRKIDEHSLSVHVIDRVIASAREHQIYYEVHPNDGSRISLQQDRDYMGNMIRGEKPEEVLMNEWLERQSAINGDIQWVESFLINRMLKCIVLVIISKK
ncbi:HAD family hydrolase [Gracilibacillus halophilus]|uniref:HAD family hydrolase n=1 Tax=Gracilibacillus halophilus TaxID=470864 RepID=UPI0003A05BED|nr:HAD family hydrolase [Gracilibacillus halophilus]